MADGFGQNLHEKLTVVVNVGDDFQLHGLYICPDLDTVTFTMAGLGHPERGWGLVDETFTAHKMLQRLGEPDWFMVGDGDLAVQLVRRNALERGDSLTQIAAHIAKGLGIRSRVVPMSNHKQATWVRTEIGRLEFQEYFVKHQHRPKVEGFEFVSDPPAGATPELLQEIEAADLMVIAPSNPFVSIGPILHLPEVRERLQARGRARLAVSPIVGGSAIKGPAAHMLRDLGYSSDCLGVAEVYAGLIDGLVIDSQDRERIPQLEERGLKVLCTSTVMGDRHDRARLAGEIVAWAERHLA